MPCLTANTRIITCTRGMRRVRLQACSLPCHDGALFSMRSPPLQPTRDCDRPFSGVLGPPGVVTAVRRHSMTAESPTWGCPQFPVHDMFSLPADGGPDGHVSSPSLLRTPLHLLPSLTHSLNHSITHSLTHSLPFLYRTPTPHYTVQLCPSTHRC